MPYKFALCSGDFDVIFVVEARDEVGSEDLGNFGEDRGDRKFVMHDEPFDEI